MATRGVSGILVVRDHHEGTARISFATNEVVSGPEGVRKAQTLQFGRGPFRGVPCKIVALREIKIEEYDPAYAGIRGHHEVDHLRLEDDSIDETGMQISWRGTGGSQIEEISYMVIGEGSD